MTWLLTKIVANPTMLLFLLLGAFLFGLSSGGSFVWWVQGIRLSHAEQEFTDYKLEQQRIVQESIDRMQKKRQEAANDFLQKETALEKDIEAGEVFKRCVAAGRCGRVRIVESCSPGISLPAKPGVDATSPDAISALTGATENPVVNDCAQTTLILNQLQREVENQEGY